MPTETSTIRVTRATRDAIWRSEYEANRIDEQNPHRQAEICEWEGTLEDGLD